MENSEIPATKTHGLTDVARSVNPPAPISIPATIVRSAGRAATMRLTRTCSSTMVPALITVTCSMSNRNVTSRPMRWSRAVTAALTGSLSTTSRRYHSTEPKVWKYRIQKLAYTTIISMNRASPSTSAAPASTSRSRLVLSGRAGSRKTNRAGRSIAAQ